MGLLPKLSFGKNKSHKVTKKASRKKKRGGLFRKGKKDYIALLRLQPVVEASLFDQLNAALDDKNQPFVAQDDQNHLIYLLALTNKLIEGTSLADHLGDLKTAIDLSIKGDMEGAISNATFENDIKPLSKNRDDEKIVFLPTVNTLNTLAEIVDPDQKFQLVSLPSDISTSNLENYYNDNKVNAFVIDDQDNMLTATLPDFKTFVKLNTSPDPNAAYGNDSSDDSGADEPANSMAAAGDLDSPDDSNSGASGEDLDSNDIQQIPDLPEDNFYDDDSSTTNDDLGNNDGNDSQSTDLPDIDDGNSSGSTDLPDIDDGNDSQSTDDAQNNSHDNTSNDREIPDLDDDNLPGLDDAQNNNHDNTSNDKETPDLDDDNLPGLDGVGNDNQDQNTPEKSDSNDTDNSKNQTKTEKDLDDHHDDTDLNNVDDDLGQFELETDDQDDHQDNTDASDNNQETHPTEEPKIDQHALQPTEPVQPTEAPHSNSANLALPFDDNNLDDANSLNNANLNLDNTDANASTTNSNDTVKDDLDDLADDNLDNINNTQDTKAISMPQTIDHANNQTGFSMKDKPETTDTVKDDLDDLANDNLDNINNTQNTKVVSMPQTIDYSNNQTGFSMKDKPETTDDTIPINLDHPDETLEANNPDKTEEEQMSEENRQALDKFRSRYEARIDNILKGIKPMSFTLNPKIDFDQELVARKQAYNDTLRNEAARARAELRSKIMLQLDNILQDITDPTRFSLVYPKIDEELKRKFVNEEAIKSEIAETNNEINARYAQERQDMIEEAINEAKQKFERERVPERDRELDKAEDHVRLGHEHQYEIAVNDVLMQQREAQIPLIDEQVSQILEDSSDDVALANRKIYGNARIYTDELLRFRDRRADLQALQPQNNNSQPNNNLDAHQLSQQLQAERLQFQHSAQTQNERIQDLLKQVKNSQREATAAKTARKTVETSLSKLQSQNIRYRQAAMAAKSEVTRTKNAQQRLLDELTNLKNHASKGDDYAAPTKPNNDLTYADNNYNYDQPTVNTQEVHQVTTTPNINKTNPINTPNFPGD